MENYNEIPWKILYKYFQNNPSFLVKHHLESYNNFFDTGIIQLFKETNPIHFFKEKDSVTTEDELKHVGKKDSAGKSIPITFDELKDLYPNLSEVELNKKWEKSTGTVGVKTNTREEYKYQFQIFMAGKKGDKVYYGKPIIYDKDGENHFMYPNEARLRNMSYAFTMHIDVEIDFKLFIEGANGIFKIEKHSICLEKIYMGKFPIMLQSKQCILYNLAPEVRFNMGECKTESGGYFIIDGKEKVIVTQEKFADNMIYVQDKGNDMYSHIAKIRSVSEDASKPIRTLSLRMVASKPTSDNGQIVVSIPNVRKPIPLFIVFRALGIISDKEIIEYCLLDIDKFKFMVDLFRPSIYDAGKIFTQAAALKFISLFTKGKSMAHALEILTMYFLPHIGERNFKQKALFLGYMANRLLKVLIKSEKPTDRDSYLYRRLEVSGILISQLFKEYYIKQQKDIFLRIDKKYFFDKKDKPNSYENMDFIKLIEGNHTLYFNNRITEIGFKRAFKGDWGSEAHTKRLGALQDLNRLSYWSAICQLRKTNVPLPGDSAKIIGPRLLNSTQWGLLCPIHSPDGGNVGLHKHLSIMTHITSGCSGYPFIEYLRGKDLNMKLLEESSLELLSNATKVFINGAWIGAALNPEELVYKLKLRRRNALFNIFVSISWRVETNEIHVWTDAGRPCHPLFPIYKDMVSYQNHKVIEKILEDNYNWDDLILGFNKKKLNVTSDNCRIFSFDDLYDKGTDLVNKGSVVEYIDTQEMEGVKLASYTEKKENYEKNFINYIEIHPSVILGAMANQIIFPSNNPYPRNAFSCGQSKQAVSLYNTNYQNRMDKTALVLHYGQNPLIRSRYLAPITKNNHPYGLNAIVAVMCYTGYNVEDAVIINEASLKRGLFRTTYFSTYESTEEKEKVGGIEISTEFMDVTKHNVIGLKSGYDYSYLDEESGLIRENILVNDKTIIIGKATIETGVDYYSDASKAPKKGQLGYIDKSFLTENEEGRRLAKIRIRHDRTPAIGDKFCSRAGQKGTIGIILPEADMPFTAEGMRPDIIVNPHAMPSRMTIGHLVEALLAKACCLHGSFGDCTAFLNKGPKEKIFGKILTKNGFSSTGNEIMYNGMTGEQLETEVYFGPTYYERLKHMVKDKINHRAKGPRSVLTRQTVGGRANDGGLRIGEMDRDAIIANGMAGFLNESMMVRGDQFRLAICNKSGTIAIYNKTQNLFVSPMVDGPIKFISNLEGDLNIVPMTRFGRDFSIINVPYAFKLLYQELQAMNIQMRIVTEDNIDQLTSLVGSNNIIKLTGNLNNFDEVTKSIEETLGVKGTEGEIIEEEEEEPEILIQTEFKISTEPIDKILGKIDKDLNSARSQLDGLSNIGQILRNTDLYSSLRKDIKLTKGGQGVTNAWLKMYEMLTQLKLIETILSKGSIPSFNVFCNAELPGAFIFAINHYISTTYPNLKLKWVGSSLFPEAGASQLSDMYGLMACNEGNWLMDKDMVGNVTDAENIIELEKRVKEKLGDIHLYTSDVGLPVGGKENDQEEINAHVNIGQIVAGLLTLSKGGILITKTYTFNKPYSIGVIILLSSLFDKFYIAKPLTSRPANSEVYYIGEGFKGITDDIKQLLLEKVKTFDFNSYIIPPFKPEFNEIHAKIIKAATHIHNEQQITFLNEVIEIHKIFNGNPYNLQKALAKVSKTIQNKWLQENPIEFLKADERLSSYDPEKLQKNEKVCIQNESDSSKSGVLPTIPPPNITDKDVYTNPTPIKTGSYNLQEKLYQKDFIRIRIPSSNQDIKTLLESSTKPSSDSSSDSSAFDSSESMGKPFPDGFEPSPPLQWNPGIIPKDVVVPSITQEHAEELAIPAIEDSVSPYKPLSSDIESESQTQKSVTIPSSSDSSASSSSRIIFQSIIFQSIIIQRIIFQSIIFQSIIFQRIRISRYR